MSKLRLIFFFFLLLFGIVIFKLFYIQVIHIAKYQTDYLRTRTIEAKRGHIYDRNKKPLALNQNNYLLFAEPKKITDDDAVEKIAKALSVDVASIEANMDKNKDWVALRSNINREERNKVDNLKIMGLGFDESFRRYYPESSLSAHLLGFVGKNDKGDNIGYFGIEGFYDQDLAGLPGVLKTERDLIDRPILIGTQERIDPENGRDLILTIDKSVQSIVKTRLIAGIDKYQATSGCSIAADPYTMQILALVCLPDYDLAEYYNYSDNVFKNPAISSLYEPGSTFKPLIMAAAIEERAVKPDEYFDENGPVRVGDYTIVTSTNTYEGKISMTRILEKSSNVGMVYIGEKLGADKLYQYLKKYQIDEETGIDIQGEVVSVLRNKDNWYPIDYATATFGQGIAMTQLQLIRAFSSIINGGNLLKPYIVMKMVDQNGEKTIKPKITNRVISEKTSEIMKKMLGSAVDNGWVRFYKPDGYHIGGKSGTAQIPIQGHYDSGSNTIASFIGFAPVTKPKFIVLVVLNQPKGISNQGSDTAGPIFFDIVRDLYVYYNINPGEE